MTIYRGAGSGDVVVVVLRAAAQDKRLSYRARGILLAVMSRPRDWRTGGAEGLALGGREGERAILTALHELEKCGYLRRRRHRIDADDAEGRHPGAVVTEWDITDDPAQLSTGPQLPQGGEPQGGEPQGGKPRGIREGEREGETTTTPAPVPDGPGGAEALAKQLLLSLDQQGAKRPTRAVVLRECRRLEAAGWSSEQLAAAVRRNSWASAQTAGAVVAWLRDLDRPPTRPGGPPKRPAWCGVCDERTRRMEDPETGLDGGRCPSCHPGKGRIPRPSRNGE